MRSRIAIVAAALALLAVLTACKAEPIRLAGIVLDADGEPVAGATVVTSYSESSPFEYDVLPDPRPDVALPDVVKTGADGRFSIPVHLFVAYRLHANVGDRQSLPAERAVRDRSPRDVTLRMPGAITVRGRVVDAEGGPVASARVRAVRSAPAANDSEADADAAREATATTDGEGRYTLSFASHGTHRIGARGSGPKWTDIQTVTTTPDRSHADADLQMPTLAPLRGRFVGANGAALSDRLVVAFPELDTNDASVVRRDDDDRRPGLRRGLTRKDGTFEIAVLPGPKWTLQLVPNDAEPLRRVVRRGFVAGAEPTDVAVTDAELAGCVVRGTLRRSDGEPVPSCTVRIVDFDAGESVRNINIPIRIEAAATEFTLPALALGSRFTIHVEPDGSAAAALAPATHGPVTFDAANATLNFELLPFADLPIQVVDANGRAMPGVRAIVYAVSRAWRSYPATTDAAGRALLRTCMPGAVQLRLLHDVEVSMSDLTLAPGINPERVVTFSPSPTRPR